MLNFDKNITAIRSFIFQEIEQKNTLGFQLSVIKGGDLLINEALGEREPNKLVNIETIFPWMSVSKMITTVALAKLWEKNFISLEDKVVKYIPNFFCKGKEDITISHILTHTCGFRIYLGQWDCFTWQEMIEKITDLPLEKKWILGETSGYHAATSWMILGEIIQLVTQQNLSDYIQENIFEPLKMKRCYMGMPIEDFFYEDNKTLLFESKRGAPINFKETIQKYKNKILLCKPGGSGRGPMQELIKFMQMLNNNGSLNDTEVLKPATVKYFTQTHRKNKIDLSLGYNKIDWGLGFMKQSNFYQYPYPYHLGDKASKESFGHNGYQSTSAWVDPINDLAVCFSFNLAKGEQKHQKRLLEIHQLLNFIY